MANDKTTAVENKAGTLEKAEVIKEGVKCLCLLRGYDDFSKVDEKTGEVKYSFCYYFDKYEGKLKNGLYSGVETVQFFSKTNDEAYLRDMKVDSLVGLSLSIIGGKNGTFTRVNKILSQKQTEALKMIYEED